MPDKQSVQPMQTMQPAEPMHSMLPRQARNGAEAVGHLRRASDLGGAISGEDVAQLAEALRAAKRAYVQHVAELRQGDVEPAEDWATWYAEYLLGVR
jgi:hypothetical protein